MRPSNKVIVFSMMVCLAFLPVLSETIYAQGPFDEISEKLDTIQETLDNEVIPKLDMCCGGLPKTGQTESYALGDDGDLEKGAPWPVPRFRDNGDGTVTDNLTGLVWLKNADCLGTKTWAEALAFCNSLADGSCGLSDGSSVGAWRLPNARELFSLIDLSQYNPALPAGHPFVNVRYDSYWSSTTLGEDTDSAWRLCMHCGHLSSDWKKDHHYVWPVRGGK